MKIFIAQVASGPANEALAMQVAEALKAAQTRPQWVVSGEESGQVRFATALMEQLRLTGKVHPDARLAGGVADVQLWLLDMLQKAPEKNICVVTDGAASATFLTFLEETAAYTVLAAGEVGQLSFTEGIWNIDFWHEQPNKHIKQEAA